MALVLTFIISSVAFAQGQAGTTLLAEKTATGFWEKEVEYDWTIEKTANPTDIELKKGESAVIGYTITVTKELASETEKIGVRGTIAVFNGGERATENLTIVDQVEYKTGKGKFQPLPGATQTIYPEELEPFTGGEYDYEIIFEPIPGAIYRNSVKVTITNHSGWLGVPFGPEPKADFFLPSAPTTIIIDDTATVTDEIFCPVGFSCVPSDPGPWYFDKSGVINYTVEITNNEADCDQDYELDNTATVTEDDTGESNDASATVNIYTGDCENGGCETAFAYGGDYANDFRDNGFSRWGWTNGLLSKGSYIFDIYAGAGQSDITKGTKVGKLTVVYDGSTATIEYQMDAGFTMSETHLYVGNAMFPKDKNGNNTVAPGQYPYPPKALTNATSDTYIVSGLSGDIYVIAHAVVCGDYK